MDLVEQLFWDSSYSSLEINAVLSLNDPIIEWIDYVATFKSDNAQSFEIGMFPGRYSNEFGKRGYTINGVDLTPRVTELCRLFKSRKYNVGIISQEDFFKFKPIRKYDVVFSVGFIEHFKDYNSIIEKHCELVDNNGIIFIIVPNFKGVIQKKLHQLIDSQNLSIHNLESMDPEKWKSTLIQQGFEIKRAGYIGGIDFWTGVQKRNVFEIFLRRSIIHAVRILRKILRRPSKHYSPYCGIIAQKKYEDRLKL